MSWVALFLLHSGICLDPKPLCPRDSYAACSCEAYTYNCQWVCVQR